MDRCVVIFMFSLCLCFIAPDGSFTETPDVLVLNSSTAEPSLNGNVTKFGTDETDGRHFVIPRAELALLQAEFDSNPRHFDFLQYPRWAALASNIRPSSVAAGTTTQSRTTAAPPAVQELMGEVEILNSSVLSQLESQNVNSSELSRLQNESVTNATFRSTDSTFHIYYLDEDESNATWDEPESSMNETFKNFTKQFFLMLDHDEDKLITANLTELYAFMPGGRSGRHFLDLNFDAHQAISNLAEKIKNETRKIEQEIQSLFGRSNTNRSFHLLLKKEYDYNYLLNASYVPHANLVVNASIPYQRAEKEWDHVDDEIEELVDLAMEDIVRVAEYQQVNSTNVTAYLDNYYKGRCGERIPRNTSDAETRPQGCDVMQLVIRRIRSRLEFAPNKTGDARPGLKPYFDLIMVNLMREAADIAEEAYNHNVSISSLAHPPNSTVAQPSAVSGGLASDYDYDPDEEDRRDLQREIFHLVNETIEEMEFNERLYDVGFDAFLEAFQRWLNGTYNDKCRDSKAPNCLVLQTVMNDCLKSLRLINFTRMKQELDLEMNHPETTVLVPSVDVGTSGGFPVLNDSKVADLFKNETGRAGYSTQKPTAAMPYYKSFNGGLNESDVRQLGINETESGRDSDNIDNHRGNMAELHETTEMPVFGYRDLHSSSNDSVTLSQYVQLANTTDLGRDFKHSETGYRNFTQDKTENGRQLPAIHLPVASLNLEMDNATNERQYILGNTSGRQLPALHLPIASQNLQMDNATNERQYILGNTSGRQLPALHLPIASQNLQMDNATNERQYILGNTSGRQLPALHLPIASQNLQMDNATNERQYILENATGHFNGRQVLDISGQQEARQIQGNSTLPPANTKPVLIPFTTTTAELFGTDVTRTKVKISAGNATAGKGAGVTANTRFSETVTPLIPEDLETTTVGGKGPGVTANTRFPQTITPLVPEDLETTTVGGKGPGVTANTRFPQTITPLVPEDLETTTVGGKGPGVTANTRFPQTVTPLIPEDLEPNTKPILISFATSPSLPTNETDSFTKKYILIRPTNGSGSTDKPNTKPVFIPNSTEGTVTLNTKPWLITGATNGTAIFTKPWLIPNSPTATSTSAADSVPPASNGTLSQIFPVAHPPFPVGEDGQGSFHIPFHVYSHKHTVDEHKEFHGSKFHEHEQVYKYHSGYPVRPAQEKTAPVEAARPFTGWSFDEEDANDGPLTGFIHRSMEGIAKTKRTATNRPLKVSPPKPWPVDEVSVDLDEVDEKDGTNNYGPRPLLANTKFAKSCDRDSDCDAQLKQVCLQGPYEGVCGCIFNFTPHAQTKICPGPETRLISRSHGGRSKRSPLINGAGTCSMDICSRHGLCYITMDNTTVCNCFTWHFGDVCQHDAYVAGITFMIILLVFSLAATISCALICWQKPQNRTGWIRLPGTSN